MLTFYQTAEPYFAAFGLTAITGAVVFGAVFSAIKWFGERWVTAKFDQRLETFKHFQQREMEQFKFQINASMDRAIKLHQREFETLPEAWSTLVTAYNSVKGIVSPFQSYADVGRMRDTELDEFLAGCNFSTAQREEIAASSDRDKSFQEASFWQRFNKVQNDFRVHHVFLLQNAIIMPPGMKEKFTAIGDLAWDALTERKITQEMKDWRQRSKNEKFEKEGEPLLRSLEAEIQKRLWSDVKSS
jgi:hypothetical protein